MIENVILIVLGVIMCANAIYMFYSMFMSKTTLGFVSHFLSGGLLAIIGAYSFLFVRDERRITIVDRNPVENVSIDTVATINEPQISIVHDTLVSTPDTLYFDKERETPYVIIVK